MLMKLLILSFFLAVAIYIGSRYYRRSIIAWFFGFPSPKFSVVVDKNIMIPLSDDVRLATDIYRPSTAGRYPVIIARTPYNKESLQHRYKQIAETFAGQGYVFIVQDVRGKFASEGTFSPYTHEGSDGNELIDWAGKASWSNGKVAVFGFSYLGTCGWLAAAHHNPHLQTIIPLFSSQNTYKVWMDNGVPYINDLLIWQATYEGRKVQNISDKQIQQSIHRLPVNELDVALVNHEISTYRKFLSHLTFDEFWKKISLSDEVNHLSLPALLISGWYDPFIQLTIDDFQRMKQSPSASKNRQSKLIIGPWAHHPLQEFKEMHFGENSHFLLQMSSILNWCDRWLKDHELPKEEFPVSYFLLGRNEWKNSREWPPEQVIYEKFFLSNREGTLSPTLPSIMDPQIFIYHPNDPVPSVGSHMIYGKGLEGPREQGLITSREDVLVYASAPLIDELTISGPIKLVLYVSSNVTDTDFYAKISDLHPDGKAYYLQSGFIRMRFRDSPEKPEFMIPDHIYRIEISLHSLAYTFFKDHRIQLIVTSSDFPHHARNLNTGFNNEETTEIIEAVQTLYAGEIYDSHLLLPMMPASN